MKRNLRFWTRFTWENMGIELVMVGVFLLVSLLNFDFIWAGGFDGWRNTLALLPFYLMIAVVLCTVVISPGCQTIYIPLLISHGEPRKNVYWGFLYHRFLLIAVTTTVSALIWLLVPCEVSAAGLSILPMIITVLLACSAVGDLMGAVYAKWKWLGIAILAVFFGICGGLWGWMVASDALDFAGFSYHPLDSELRLSWPAALTAAVLLAIDLGIQWLLLRRREVKF